MNADVEGLLARLESCGDVNDPTCRHLGLLLEKSCAHDGAVQPDLLPKRLRHLKLESGDAETIAERVALMLLNSNVDFKSSLFWLLSKVPPQVGFGPLLKVIGDIHPTLDQATAEQAWFAVNEHLWRDWDGSWASEHSELIVESRIVPFLESLIERGWVRNTNQVTRDIHRLQEGNGDRIRMMSSDWAEDGSSA